MARVSLDPLGRLLELEIVPPQRDTVETAAVPNWGDLFAAAGLDPSRFAATTPQWTPANYCDRARRLDGQ
jgi:hypothetical protein